MGFGLLFVPLVGGYLFLTWCHRTQFLVRRQSGHHLLFQSASVGLVLLAVARGLEMLADDAPQMFPHVVEHWQKAAPFPYVGRTALAFLLGPSAALLLNWFYTESMGAMRAVHRDGNSMELLFLKSMESDSLVEITLHSRKVYVGWILNASVAEPERKFVEILPLASGFRSDETHELQFTTNYAEVLAQPSDDSEPATDNDFRVVLPVTDVRSARSFDFGTYFLFQEVGTIA